MLNYLNKPRNTNKIRNIKLKLPIWKLKEKISDSNYKNKMMPMLSLIKNNRLTLNCGVRESKVFPLIWMFAKPLLKLSKNNSMIYKDKLEIWPIWWLKINLCLTISPNVPEITTTWRVDLINFWSSHLTSNLVMKRIKRMKLIWLLLDRTWPEVNNKEMNSNYKLPKFLLWIPNYNHVKLKPTNWEIQMPT